MTLLRQGDLQVGQILGCASQGSGSNDEVRLIALISHFNSRLFAFDRKRKLQSFLACLRELRRGEMDLLVLEGTGFAAGFAAILGRVLWRRPYVLSSGDAITPFLGSKHPVGTPLFWLYERLLYANCSGFIGWTPYLAGRALTMGAKRAVTIPGWAPALPDEQTKCAMRVSTRQHLGIPQDAVVFGLVGSLSWSQRFQFCYGAELVRAAVRCSKLPYVLIVGDGTGLDELQKLAGPELGRHIFLTGRVPREDVPRYLAAMDFGSLPQSVDGVGSFRYTTKLPEYRNAGLLVVTNQIPMAYDLDRGDIVRLRGRSPWDETFIQDLTALMQATTIESIAMRKGKQGTDEVFDREQQIERVTSFLSDVLAAEHTRSPEKLSQSS